MKLEAKDLGSGDAARITPGKHAVVNEEDSLNNEMTAEKSTLEDADGNKVETTPTGIKWTNSSGHTLEINIANGFVLTKGDNKLEASFENGFVLTKDGHTSKLADLSILLDDGEGNSTTINKSLLEITNDEKTGAFEPNSITLVDSIGNLALDTENGLQGTIGSGTMSLKPEGLEMDDGGSNSAALSGADGLLITQGDNTASLDADKLQIAQGDDFARVSPAGGLDTQSSDYQAKVSPAGGVHLESSGGDTVDIATQSGENISIQDTDTCGVDDSGEPVTITAKFLRGEETTA